MFDNFIFSQYEDELYELKLEEKIETMDCLNLLNKTLLFEDVNDLYKTLKELGTSHYTIGEVDSYTCFLLWKKIETLLAIKYDWKKLVEKNGWDRKANPKEIFRNHFKLFILGQINEIVDQNLTNLREYFSYEGIEELLTKIDKVSTKIVYKNTFEGKIKLIDLISGAQMNFYNKKNFLLDKNIIETKKIKPYLKKWDKISLTKYYSDTIVFINNVDIIIKFTNSITRAFLTIYKRKGKQNEIKNRH